MFGNKPVIGITGPEEGGRAAWHCTALSIRLAGGKPIRITPDNPGIPKNLDGLIIGGGADVDPGRYGQERLINKEELKKKKNLFEALLSILLYPIYFFGRYIYRSKKSPVDKSRDRLEFELLNEAMSQNLPVLGICRGMQLMNIHFKGTLHQDIRGFYSETPKVTSIFPRKKVVLQENSRLREILGTGECDVNALHNQAIDHPGVDIELVAREPGTGVIQAIEHSKKQFVIGVQWHPEYLIQIKKQRNIFKELVKEAAKKRAGNEECVC